MPAALRPADPSDRPTLEVIRRQAIEAALSPHLDRAAYAECVASPEARLPEWIDRDRYHCLLIDTDVTPVAFGTLDREECHVQALCTAPDYAGLGHASRILANFEEGVAPEPLTVDVPAPTAGFLEARGYVRTAGPTDDPIPHVSMANPEPGNTDL